MDDTGKPEVLKLQNVSKSYGRKKAVDSLTLTAYEGDIYGFLGPNGSGKTTTIRMITGLIWPDKGRIEICGNDLKKKHNSALANIGAIVEYPIFYDYMSGHANLRLISRYYSGIGNRRVDEVLETVGMINEKHRKVRTYSLGMRQRLGIAAALLNQPKVVILDEPTNGLDPQGVIELREFIKELANTFNITFFISSHILKEIESICNRVGIISNGRMVAEGYLDDLLSSEQDVAVISVDNIQKAEDLARQQSYVVNCSVGQNKLYITTQKGRLSDITSMLVYNGIAVETVTKQLKSLEAFFIQATKGGTLK